MFWPNKMLPFILNLEVNTWRCDFVRDGARDDGGQLIEAQYGDFRRFTPYAVVDVGLELTLPELADRMNWFRCYADLMPKRRPTFDWDYWRKYYVAKFGTKPVGGEVLDSIGQVIADGHRPEFVSATVLKELELCG